MSPEAQYYLVQLGSLKATFNLALGYEAHTKEPITGSIIRERVRKNVVKDTTQWNFSIYQQVWALNFAFRFFRTKAWGSLPPNEKEILENYCNSIELDKLLKNPDYCATLLVKTMKSIITEEYAKLYEILVHIMIYGIYTRREDIVGTAAITIRDSLK